MQGGRAKEEGEKQTSSPCSSDWYRKQGHIRGHAFRNLSFEFHFQDVRDHGHANASVPRESALHYLEWGPLMSTREKGIPVRGAAAAVPFWSDMPTGGAGALGKWLGSLETRPGDLGTVPGALGTVLGTGLPPYSPLPTPFQVGVF